MLVAQVPHLVYVPPVVQVRSTVQLRAHNQHKGLEL